MDLDSDNGQLESSSSGSGPAGAILVVDDERAIRVALAEELRTEGYVVYEADSAREARSIFQRELLDLVLLDLRLGGESGLDLLREFKEERSEAVVIIMTAYGVVEDAVEALKRGAYDFITKPFDFTKILVEVKNAIQGTALKEEVRFHRRRQRPRFDKEVVLGASPAMAGIMRLVDRVAPSIHTSVLLLGETGAGKEVVARTIHWRSPNADGPFVDVNCSSIPNDLLESELFGHEKGSFTSADRTKKGLFEIAHGGTLFLDEIGEMSTSLQSKLLRVLEDRRFRRVGGTQQIGVSLRVIAATNKDLTERIADGRFREDLYYRLAVVKLEIPPLRQRIEDLDSLADCLLANLERELGRKAALSAEARELIRSYSWPGNVRELRNVLERAILLCDRGTIVPDNLPEELRRPAGAGGGGNGPRYKGPVPTMAEAERDAIITALGYTRGNKTRAAELLQISRQTLRSKVRQYNIEDSRPPARTTGELVG